jgi:hypothetical protein
MIKIQKRDIKFFNHRKGSDTQTFHNKAIAYREMNLEKNPLSKLVLGLGSQTQTHPTEPQDSNTIRPNQTKILLLDTLERIYLKNRAN